MQPFVRLRTIRQLLPAILIPAVASVALSAAGFAVFASPAQTSTATDQSAPRKTSQPYTGDLSIFENKDRDEKLQVQRVMDILGVKEGAHVADIGAGSGWYTVRAAKRVGSAGIVYAADINPEAITYINKRAQREGIGNVRTILSDQDDPRLPKDSIDSVLLLKTYHEVAHPIVLLKNLRSSLRSGAKIGIIDRNGKGDDHGVSRDIVVKEAAEAGYQLKEEYDFVKGDGQDYFLVFAFNPATR